MRDEFIPKPEEPPNHHPWADKSMLWVEAIRPWSKLVLSTLESAQAFEDLPPCRCDRELVKLKVAEILVDLFYDLGKDDYKEIVAHHERRVARIDAFNKAASLLRPYDPEQADRLEMEVVEDMATLPPRCGLRSFVESDRASVIGRHIARLVTVLRHTTTATSSYILREVIPIILDVMSEAAEIRGLDDPETRFKRWAKSCRGTPEQVISRFREKTFSWDTRFPASLFQPIKPKRTIRRR